MTDLIPNAALAYRVLDHIDARPGDHEQGVWIRVDPECGTSACFAGWACLLAGGVPTEMDEDGETCAVEMAPGYAVNVSSRAAVLLGIDYPLSNGRSPGERLFSPENSRARLGELVEEIFGPRPASTDTDTDN